MRVRSSSSCTSGTHVLFRSLGALQDGTVHAFDARSVALQGRNRAYATRHTHTCAGHLSPCLRSQAVLNAGASAGATWRCRRERWRSWWCGEARSGRGRTRESRLDRRLCARWKRGARAVQQRVERRVQSCLEREREHASVGGRDGGAVAALFSLSCAPSRCQPACSRSAAAPRGS